MAEWPDTAELAQVLDVSNVDDWQTTLDRVLAAAIAQVSIDAADWLTDHDDEPDESLAQAALRMAELISQRPNATPDGSRDPTYAKLLRGHRRRFAFA